MEENQNQDLKDETFRELNVIVSTWFDQRKYVDMKVLYRDHIQNTIELTKCSKTMDYLQLLIDSGNLSQSDVSILYDTIALTQQFGLLKKLKHQLQSLHIPNLKNHVVTNFTRHRQRIVKFGMALTEEDVHKICGLNGLQSLGDSWRLIQDLEHKMIISEENMDEFVNKLKKQGLLKAVRALSEGTVRKRSSSDLKNQPSPKKRFDQSHASFQSTFDEPSHPQEDEYKSSKAQDIDKDTSMLSELSGEGGSTIIIGQHSQVSLSHHSKVAQSIVQIPEVEPTDLKDITFRKLNIFVAKWFDKWRPVNMKVLYKDLIHNAVKLDQCSKTGDFFNLLIASGNLSRFNITILYDTIVITQQFGLEEKLRKDQLPSLSIPNLKNHVITHFTPYRQGLVKLGMALTEHDICEICTFYDLKKHKDSWSLILDLERRLIIGEGNMEKFIEDLRTLEIAETVTADLSGFNSMQPTSLQTAKPRKAQELSGFSSMQPTSHETANQRDGQGGLKIEKYKMTSSPRGICLIINNMEFTAGSGLEERKGSEIDEERLKDVFTYLGFEVEIHRNKTAAEMLKTADKYRSKDHSKYDCFVCCILSHGGLGILSGSDGTDCKIVDITSLFRPKYCPTLASKPKLFFLQACQGDRDSEMFSSIKRDYVHTSSKHVSDDADFLLGYATAPGNVAYRYEGKGSLYITELTKCLKEFHVTLDILGILTKVNSEVNKVIVEGKFTQIPAPQYTLRGQLFFPKL